MVPVLQGSKLLLFVSKPYSSYVYITNSRIVPFKYRESSKFHLFDENLSRTNSLGGRRAVNEYNEVIVTTVEDKLPMHYEKPKISSLYSNRP